MSLQESFNALAQQSSWMRQMVDDANKLAEIRKENEAAEEVARQAAAEARAQEIARQAEEKLAQQREAMRVQMMSKRIFTYNCHPYGIWSWQRGIIFATDIEEAKKMISEHFEKMAREYPEMAKDLKADTMKLCVEELTFDSPIIALVDHIE